MDGEGDSVSAAPFVPVVPVGPAPMTAPDPTPSRSPANMASSVHTSPRSNKASEQPSRIASPKTNYASTKDSNYSKSMRSTASSPAPMTSKEVAVETRKDVIRYIRNERDTAQVKWMQLTENLNNEDRIRDDFVSNRLQQLHRSLPLQVKKLIGNLKRAVHKTMSSVGGTPFSILRQLFIYWDRNNNGSLSYSDFSSALRSLQIAIPAQDLKDIFSFYSHTTASNGRMGYHELLSDIQRDEPSILYFLGDKVKDSDSHELRFEEAGDEFKERPKRVTLFIEAIRAHILDRMRIEGGTLEYHVKKMFQNFDFNYSSALDPDELLAAAKGSFHLNFSREDAELVVKYFDRRKTGEMTANQFIEAVCEGQSSMLSFNETTKEAVAAEKKKVRENPFVKTEFRPKPNKLFERIKEKIRNTLDVRLNRKGGSYTSWVTEAFSFWDPMGTGVFSHWQHLQGAILRLGVYITQDEATSVLACFDESGTGQVKYKTIMKNILEDETNLITPANANDEKSHPDRAPKAVELFNRKIKTAIDIFVKKSKGSLDPRDVLHGTFLRFDSSHTGRISKEDFVQVAKELGVTVSSSDAGVVIQWFDTNGLGSLDYNELTRQLYGDDQFNRPMTRATSSNTRSSDKSKLTSAPPSNLCFNGTALTSHPVVSKASYLSFLDADALAFDSSVIRDNAAKSPMGASQSSSLITKFGVLDGNHWVTTATAPLPADKKLLLETKLIKQARKKMRKNLILQERAKIVSKIESIEQQRRSIIEDHKLRAAEKLRKQRQEEWEHKVNGKAPDS
jgi:Ca2+-binding EF-hand superfamily protein